MPIDPEHLLECAQRSGAVAVEVHSLESRSQTISFEANAPKQIEATQSQGIAVRLWQSEAEAGVAVAYGSVDPQRLIEKAWAVVAPSDPPLLNSAPPPQWDYAAPDVATADLVCWGKETIAKILDQFPDVICEGSWSQSQSQMRLLNSAGLDYGRADWGVGGGVQATWVRGDDLLAITSDQDWAPRGERLHADCLIKPIVTALCRRLGWASRSAAAPVGQVPVILLPKVASLVWDSAAAALNGRQVLLGASPWQLGQVVMAGHLSLHQDPHQGYAAVPADDEGTPTSAATFIDAGVVKHFYGDRQVAQQLQQPAFGNGFRGRLGSPATPDLFNLIAPAPTLTFQELLQSLDCGIIVDQVLGDADPLSGDFAVNVDVGYRVDKGEIVGRLKDTLITGNAYAILKGDLGLGAASPEQPREWDGLTLTPALRIPQLSVASDLS